MNERAAATIFASPPAEIFTVPARIPSRVAGLVHHPGFHVSRNVGGGASVGVLVAVAFDSTVLAALIAGGFTLVNTILTVWLTGLKRPPRDELAERRRRRRGRRRDRREQDSTDVDS